MVKGKKFWPIRKGCMQCGNVLRTTKEKFTRTCTDCASRALDGFQDMSEGKLKSGFKKVMGAGNVSDDKAAVISSTISRTLSSQGTRVEKKVLRQCRKEGLSEEEAKKYLKELKQFGKL